MTASVTQAWLTLAMAASKSNFARKCMVEISLKKDQRSHLLGNVMVIKE
jgi:hypothetical protein